MGARSQARVFEVALAVERVYVCVYGCRANVKRNRAVSRAYAYANSLTLSCARAPVCLLADVDAVFLFTSLAGYLLLFSQRDNLRLRDFQASCL